VGLVVNVGLLRAAAAELGRLSGLSMALLIGGALLHRAMQTALLTGSVRQLRWTRALVASEAHSGCSNSMVGGGAIGAGVKASMLRSWGVDAAAIATSMTVTAVVPTVAMWSLALVHTAPQVLAGTASTNETLVAAGAVLALVLQIGFWSLALRHAALTRRLCDLVASVTRRVALRCRGRLRRWQDPLLGFDAHALAARMRTEALQLARRRSLRLFALGITSQLCLALVLVVALWGLGGRQASLVEVFQAFTMARVAASFVPLPGGLGVLDVGLFAGLVHAGASPAVVVAALVVYRASTFALPIITGCAALLWWRRRAVAGTAALQLGGEAARPAGSADGRVVA